MKIERLVDSFNNAINGIIYAARTEKNMQIHIVASILVLTLCFFYDLSKIELLLITITITMVIASELINTAIERTIDLSANYYHPLAKVAKNTAAGAVFVTAVNAVVVGFIVFWDRLAPFNAMVIYKIKNSNSYMIFFLLIIVCLATVIVKALFGEGTPLRGGMPSGHSTIAFSIATIIALLSAQVVVIILSYLMAFIVAQSRVDSKVHSIFEVVSGACFGVLLTLVMFKLLR